MTNWIWDETGFETANQNMRYDEQLAESLVPGERILRAYHWSQPSITLPYGRTRPDFCNTIDWAYRCSGGGLLFHAPGDLVFSVITELKDPLWPKRLKDKMGALTTLFERVFHELDIPTYRSNSQTPENRAYCNQYHNPFELYVDNQKILAMALRRFQRTIVVQGIIHRKNGQACFAELGPDYQRFLTRGLEGNPPELCDLG